MEIKPTAKSTIICYNSLMQIVHAPDPRLGIKTKPVKKITPGLIQTLKNMIKLTQTFTDPEGVGLASIQVGLGESFFVARLHDSKQNPPQNPTQRSKRWARYGKEFTGIINPKILSHSKRTKTYFEGCLSVPDIWGGVKRHTSIKVSYQDEKSNQITKTLKGISAWIFQHEMDHLNGVLFSHRVLEQKGKFYKYTGKDKTGADTFEEMTI